MTDGPTGPAGPDGPDGHDEFDDWLRRSVRPLPPPPGTYERVKRHARRRRLGKALGVGSVAALIVIGGAAVPSMIRAASPAPYVPTPSGSSGPLTTPAPTTRATHVAPPHSPPPHPSSAGTGSITATRTHHATPPPAGPSRCHTGDLSVRVTGGDAGAGQRYAGVVLTNTSGGGCTVYGYIGVALSGPHGPVPTHLVRDPGTRDHITLSPGDSAATSLHWSAVPDPGEGPYCGARTTRIEVTPPDETTQRSASWPYGGVCRHGEMHTVPLVPGTSPPPI